MSIDIIEDFNPIYFVNKKIPEVKVFKNQIQLNFDKENYILVQSICELFEDNQINVFEAPYDINSNLKLKLENKLVKYINKDPTGAIIINFEDDIKYRNFTHLNLTHIR